MPGQWTSIETNFPTITGDEPVNEQIKQLHNYMYILTEQLKYNLSNLNTTNWNATALKQLTDDTSSEVAAAVAKDLERIMALYNQLSSSVGSLHNTLEGVLARVSSAEDALDGLTARMDLAEDALGGDGELQQRLKQLELDLPVLEEKVAGEGGLEARMGEAEEYISDLQSQVNGESGLEARTAANEEALEKLQGAVSTDEAGATIGGEGKDVFLVGNIYINGILYQQAQEPEEEVTT